MYCVLNKLSFEEEIALTRKEIERQNVCIPAGYYKLTAADLKILHNYLDDLSGSTTIMHKLSDWILAKPNNSMDISIFLRNFVTDSNTGYDKKLFTLFVINDILNELSKSTDTKTTEFGRAIIPQFPYILLSTFQSGRNEVEETRVMKLLNIWYTKS